MSGWSTPKMKLFTSYNNILNLFADEDWKRVKRNAQTAALITTTPTNLKWMTQLHWYASVCNVYKTRNSHIKTIERSERTTTTTKRRRRRKQSSAYQSTTNKLKNQKKKWPELPKALFFLKKKNHFRCFSLQFNLSFYCCCCWVFFLFGL